jgi:hypothetical protein
MRSPFAAICVLMCHTVALERAHFCMVDHSVDELVRASIPDASVEVGKYALNILQVDRRHKIVPTITLLAFRRAPDIKRHTMPAQLSYDRQTRYKVRMPSLQSRYLHDVEALVSPHSVIGLVVLVFEETKQM